ncbi:MAG TPA: hypothetical protein VHE35_35735 [Kofleriaceae bacterium]|nr:hypothetical protein [Kofleriaceae bacterium]
MTQAALLGSAVAGVLFVGLGVYGVFATDLPHLFCFSLIVIGALGLVLAERAGRRRRAPWAYLVAMWGVVAFCAFFTAPKVLSLPKLRQVTVELELQHGRDKAIDLVSDENLRIRATNLGLCVLFAAPFAGLSFALARGRRDYERPA